MGSRGGFPLCGREVEVGVLQALVQESTSGRGGIALIEGEPGIGKTRVIDQVASAAGTTCQIFRGAGQELEQDRPFGVIAAALQLGTADPGSAGTIELKRLLHGEASPLEASEGPALRYRIIDHLVDLVVRRVREGPVVLALEDIQWSDPSTLLTVQRLAATVYEFPVVLLVTARPAPRSAELDRVMAGLVDNGAVRLSLGPLSEAAVEQLTALLTGARPAPELLQELERAAGNPFFIIELVRTLAQEGAIRLEDGQAHLKKRMLPPSLRLTVLAGLSFLSGETLALLRLASVLGSSFEPADLSVMSQEPLTTSLPKLREALDANVLVEDGDRLVFRHALVREAIYEDLPLGLRKGLHRQAGGAFAAAGRPTSDVATHMALGAVTGDREAVEWLRRAGREAGPRDPGIQVQLLKRAAALLDVTDPERDELQGELLPALVWAGGLVEAEEVARGVLARGPSPEAEIRVRRALAQGLHFQGRPADAFEHAAQLVGAEGLSGGQRAHASAELAYHRLFLGDVSGAVTEAERAIESAAIQADDVAAWKGTVVLAVAAYFAGDTSSGVHLATRAMAAHEDLVACGLDEPGLWSFVVVLPLVDADEVERAARVVHTEWKRRDAVFQTASYHYFMAICHFVTGKWEEATTFSRSWLEISQETGLTWGAGVIYSILVRLAVHAEDLSEADRWIEVAQEDFAKRPRGGFDVYLVMWAQAFVAEARGDHDLALTLLGAAWDIITQIQAVAHYRLVGPDYVRVLIGADRRDVAREVVALVEEAADRAGDVASARGAALHARAALEEDAKIASEAVETYRRGPRRYEFARACEDAGRLFLQAGMKDKARALLVEAADVYGEMPARRDAVRVDAALRSLGMRGGRRRRQGESRTGWEALTRTERKVTALIVEGLSNPEIAARLYISRRTVDSHLSHIFAKLGVSSRVELAMQAAQKDLASGA